MSKLLIIAEKPSVATDLARVLGKLPEMGKFKKHKDLDEHEDEKIDSNSSSINEITWVKDHNQDSKSINQN